jgi:YidC/Oxa1 family membrane protein insertase
MPNIYLVLKEGLIGIFLQLYQVTGNLGVALIAFTLLARLILFPLSIQSLRAQKKIRELQPEVDKLKEKHGKDKQALQVAQMELYKKYNLNPLAGCIPQLIQIGLFIVIYQALNQFLHQTAIHGITIDPSFLGINLNLPDSTYVLPVLAGVTQLLLSVMVLPATETPDIIPNKTKNKAIKAANEKEEDMAEMAASMQQQMVFILPFVVAFSATRFPAGLALYWVATTVFSIIQQYLISGPGGLVTYSRRLLARVSGVKNS